MTKFFFISKMVGVDKNGGETWVRENPDGSTSTVYKFPRRRSVYKKYAGK
jgi:hypothetical protein